MQVKISAAISIITQLIRAKLVPLVKGSPGVGKSDIIHKIAADFGLKVIDLRLAQCDPTDMLGFPQIQGSKAGYVPMETFPIESDEIPKGYNGWLLFLDELTSAPKSIQSASYKIILDRMVGNHKLHPNVAVVAAGNLESDNAIVESMSTALQSRLVHLEIAVDKDEWLDWAANVNIDHRICSFIRFRPDLLHNFNPDHTDCTYACPRTWKFADQILKVTEDSSPERRPMLAGALSEGVATELMAFMQIYKSLPSIAEIVSDPMGTMVSNDPSVLFAITGSIANHADADNIAKLVQYVNRLPVEFQVVCLREAIRRNKALMSTPTMQAWIAKNANELY